MSPRTTDRLAWRPMHRMLGVAAVALLLSGCAQSPFADDSFREKIPDAIESSDLGITDAWADKGLDGFTTVLSVGAPSNPEP